MGSFNFLGRRFAVERDRNGVFTYTFMRNDGFQPNKNYLEWSLENPVLLAILALRCSVYSQMKIIHVNTNGEEVKNSPYVKLLKQPNYFQSQEDFLFQEMWFKSVDGTCLTYQVKALSEVKALYNLIPQSTDYIKTNKLKKFITTKADFKSFGEQTIKYTLDGQEHNFKIDDLIASYDLANGLTCDSFMRSPSRIKGIEKVLCNIDENTKAKNTNLKMTQKYLVANKSTGNEAQIQDGDRKDIFDKISRKDVMITNAAIEAKHLVSDMKRLYLDEQFSSDALTCVLAFGMSRDVLNYFSNGASTYDNEEKAMQNYIQNMVQPDADKRMNSFNAQWGLIDKGEKLIASYAHLPVMAGIVNEKIATLKSMQETIKIGLENGTITAPEAKKMTDSLILTFNL